MPEVSEKKNFAVYVEDQLLNLDMTENAEPLARTDSGEEEAMSSDSSSKDGHIAQSSSSLNASSLTNVQDATQQKVFDTIGCGDWDLIKAPPGSRKSTSASKYFAKNPDEKFAYFTSQRRLYDQMEKLCRDFGIPEDEIVTQPNPFDHCSGFEENSEARRRYNLGISALQIHQDLNLDCQPNCDYVEWLEEIKANSDQYRVRIGNHRHLYRKEIFEERSTVIDEFNLDTFEEKFRDIRGLLNQFFEEVDLPLDNFDDLIRKRMNDSFTAECRSWFRQNDVTPSPKHVSQLPKHDQYHTLAPFLTWALLNTTDLDNGFEVYLGNLIDDFEDLHYLDCKLKRRVVYNAKAGEGVPDVYLLTVPDLSDANGVTGLDATARKRLWDLVFDTNFEFCEILDDLDQKREFYKQARGSEYILYNDNKKPYNSKGRVGPYADSAVNFDIWKRTGREPFVLTTKKAREVYRKEGVLGLTSGSINYGSAIGRNDLGDKDHVVVHGYPSLPDEQHQRLAAYFGVGLERPNEDEGITDRFKITKDSHRDWIDSHRIKQTIKSHYGSDKVLQAMMRFGRTPGANATYFLNTNVVPEWLAGNYDKRRQTKQFRKERFAILEHVQERAANGMHFTTKGIAKAVGVDRSTAYRVLNDWKDDGIVEKLDRKAPNGYTMYTIP